MIPTERNTITGKRNKLPEIAGVDDTLWQSSVHARLGRGELVKLQALGEARFTDDSTGLTVTLRTYDPDVEDDFGIRTLAGVQELILGNVPGCHYLNPRFTVSSDKLCDEFVKRARQCRVEWCMTLKRLFRSGGRRRMARSNKPLIREMRHTGIMVLDGLAYNPYVFLKLPHEKRAKKAEQHHAK